MVDTKNRSTQSEILDDFQGEKEKLAEMHEDLARINHLLGGNSVLIDGIQRLAKPSNNKPITIVDIGCGAGDSLRKMATYGRENNFDFKLIGIDNQLSSIELAKEQSSSFPEISYHHCDVFSNEFLEITFDIALLTLTLHHFNNTEITQLMKRITRQATRGVIVNDLHRSRFAYYLFKLIALPFLKSPITKHDGLVSILRGFKRSELQAFGEGLEAAKQQIRWKWAFRYQWIIQL